MTDRNKTPLTTRITATAAAYLDGAGFKPVETEVPVAPGWTADLASYIYPSPTQAHRLRLVAKRRVRHNYFPVDDKAYRELQYRTGPLLTALVEVKITAGDLKKDADRKFAAAHPPAHLCYLAYPKGLIAPEAVPCGWIGLETTADGRRIIRRHQPIGTAVLHPQHPGDIADFCAQVGIRRDHRTRYRAMSAFMRAHRAKDRDHRRADNASRFLTGLLDWLVGRGFYASAETIPDLLRLAGWTCHLTQRAEAAAQEIQAMRCRPAPEPAE